MLTRIHSCCPDGIWASLPVGYNWRAKFQCDFNSYSYWFALQLERSSNNCKVLNAVITSIFRLRLHLYSFSGGGEFVGFFILENGTHELQIICSMFLIWKCNYQWVNIVAHCCPWFNLLFHQQWPTICGSEQCWVEQSSQQFIQHF